MADDPIAVARHRRPTSALAPALLVVLALALMGAVVIGLRLVADHGATLRTTVGGPSSSASPAASDGESTAPAETAPSPGLPTTSTTGIFGPTNEAPGVLLPAGSDGTAAVTPGPTTPGTVLGTPPPSSSAPHASSAPPSPTPPVTATPTTTKSRGDPQGAGSTHRHTPTHSPTEP